MTQQDNTAKKQEGAANIDSSSTASKVTNSTNAASQAEKRTSNPQTPKQNKAKDGENKSESKQFAQSAATPQVAAFSGKSNQQANSTGKKPSKYQHGRQKNFYNPPGKVLRHLAQQSYYDNFYGNQGQFYTLKQKYKTQLCRHFTETGTCSLDKYCQFAHGPTELRQANDVSITN